VLLVNAAADGPIDNLTVPSDIVAGYAPAGSTLIYASIRGDRRDEGSELVAAVQGQAAGWLGQSVRDWTHLTTVSVPSALPDESPAARRDRPTGPRLAPGLFICGDHCTTASINGALASGRLCAEAMLASGHATP
jgi:hypothetical protein